MAVLLLSRVVAHLQTIQLPSVQLLFTSFDISIRLLLYNIYRIVVSHAHLMALFLLAMLFIFTYLISRSTMN